MDPDFQHTCELHKQISATDLWLKYFQQQLDALTVCEGPDYDITSPRGKHTPVVSEIGSEAQ